MFKCPVCGSEWRDSFNLACHVVGDHGWRQCACGFPERERELSVHLHKLGEHFAAFCTKEKIDLEMHVAEANLLKASREKRGSN